MDKESMSLCKTALDYLGMEAQKMTQRPLSPKVP